jgi:hypothetical protein
MISYFTFEQKVEALPETSAELKKSKELLKEFLRIQQASLDAALAKARQIAEHIIDSVLTREAIKKTALNDDIETLGSSEQKASQRRGGRGPILPPQIFGNLHAVRIYGNKAVHYQPGATDCKPVVVGPMDVQVALGLLLRVVEWYFAEYEKGP